MNHIKTMLCGNFIGIDKLERLRLLQSDPLVNEFAISIKEPETVSRFVGNFSLLGAPLHQETFFAAGMQHSRGAGPTRHTRQFLDGWEGKLSGDRRRLSDGKIDIDYLGDPGGN